MLRSHREDGLEGEKPPGTHNNDKNTAEVTSGVTPKYYPLRNEVPPSSVHTHGVMRTTCGWCKLLDFIMV